MTTAAPARSGSERRALGAGMALSLSAVITGVAGLVCWVVAAGTLPQEAVGRAASFVSGFVLVAGIAQLNVGLGLLRWLPGAGGRTGWLVGRGYLLVGLAAAVGGVVFVLLPVGRAAAPGMLALLFVVASVCWALFQLQDYVLAALGRVWWVPLFNGAFGLVRVAVLPVLGAALGALGVLTSWAAPTVVCAAVAGVLITLMARRKRAEPVPADLPDRRTVVSFLGPTYLATIGTTVLYNVVPLIVTARFGPASGAVFFVVWNGLTATDYAINGFVNSMVLRGSGDPEARPAILRAVGKRLGLLVGSGVVVGLALAPLLLGLFGPGYAEEGSGALRILLAGLVARTVVALGVAIRLMDGDGMGAARIQLSCTALVVGGVLLVPTGVHLQGPALGFVLAQVLVGALVVPSLVRRLRGVSR
jgi:O-antigen/teichoic acid export membrane protein